MLHPVMDQRAHTSSQSHTPVLKYQALLWRDNQQCITSISLLTKQTSALSLSSLGFITFII